MPLMLVLFPNCMESFENDLSRINFAVGAEKFRLIFAKRLNYYCVYCRLPFLVMVENNFQFRQLFDQIGKLF